MKRLQTMRANGGMSGVILHLALMPGIAILCVLAALHQGMPWAALVCLALPWIAAGLLRNVLVDRAATVQWCLRVLGIGIAISCWAAGYGPEEYRPALFCVTTALVGIYGGLHFWTFSDDRLVPVHSLD